MSRALRVAVVGGGIGGLSAAIALSRIAGVEVTVFEQASQLGEVGAGVGMAPNGMRMLERLGLKDAVERVAARYGVGSLYYRYDGTPIGEMTTSDSSGTYHTLGVHRADIVGVLAAALPDGAVRTGHRLASVHDRGGSARLEFENGSSAEFDAVIGADGIHSVVRGFTTEPTEPVSSGSIAYRGLVHADRLPDWPKGIAQLWMGEGKHFLTYPVRAGRLINYVGFVPSEERLKESWSAAGDQESLAAEFVGWDPRVTRLIEVVESTFWWGLYDREPLARWSQGRVTLLGDAAHPMLPHLGQGANQAIEDAVTLAVVLRGADPDDVPARLENYERLRLERTSAVQRGARDNGRRYDSAYDDLTQRDDEIARSRDYRLWLYDYDAEAVALDARVR
ncbi:FAD-dependent monooxygenase [Microbacterium immunditiarum]|uniref:Salicylate hydroxylase n=1 Tax=Microbacterium immunditiarum TaxID=337480 RepID=A0A7Y9KGB6_9MICO|nr:FAD-dependent monooxygenase [Microbacterium immunditiarum]NYE18277.1 salicylate hydroxylase [Microbacterium immunditiarum]